MLSGLVLLNGAPTLNSPEFTKCQQTYKLPDRSKAQKEFLAAPSKQTATKLSLSSVPYAFTSEFQTMGKAYLNNIEFSPKVAYWWKKSGIKQFEQSQWIPSRLPTFIIGASHDFIVPKSLFEQDLQFYRDNIHIHTIQNAGHYPWLESPEQVKEFFGKIQMKMAQDEC